MQSYTSVSSCIILGALKCILGHFWSHRGKNFSHEDCTFICPCCFISCTIYFFITTKCWETNIIKAFYVRIEAGASMTTGRWHLSVQKLKSSFFIPKSKRKKHYTSFFRAVFSASIASFWVVNDCISTLSGRISPSNCWIWETTMLTCLNNYELK